MANLSPIKPQTLRFRWGIAKWRIWAENSIENGLSRILGLEARADSADTNTLNLQYLHYPLDRMRQTYYRNLEGDNQLPTADYEGQARPTGTPITLVEITEDGEYIFANMPFIKALIEDPQNWLTYSVASDWPDYTNTAVKIMTVDYIGDYTVDVDDYTNCCKITTLEEIPEVAVGHKMCVLTFRAYGIRFRYTPVVAPDSVAGSWKKSQTGMQFMYRHSDGRYIGMVNGDNSTLTGADKRIQKLVYTSDPLNGEWVGLFNDIEDNVDDIREMDILPDGAENYVFLRVEKMDGQDGMYIGAVSLWDASNAVIGIGLCIFNEGWTYRKIIQPNIEYDYAIAMSAVGYGLVYTKYKGKHMISVQDGTHITGKRVMLVSNNIEGPYILHSTVYDFDTDLWLLDPGSMFRTSIANVCPFVYNNELYMITSGQPGGTVGESYDKDTGMSTKHCAYLWKYDDAKNSWNVVINPMLVGLHAKTEQYDDIPDTTWGNLHLGGCFPQFIEDGKLWIIGSVKGYGPVYAGSTAAYNASLLQIDLVKALLK